MITRAWLFLCVIAGQGLGFLTLTPPEEAFENLQKWWIFAKGFLPWAQ
jgi:hypothetical protein